MLSGYTEFDQEKYRALHWCRFTDRNIALTERVNDTRVCAGSDATSPVRLVRWQQPPPVLVPSLPVQNLRRERVNFRNHANMIPPLQGENLGGSPHGDDGVVETDVREEEREPAREGTEAPLGTTEA
jgi:hypothetical protein